MEHFGRIFLAIGALFLLLGIMLTIGARFGLGRLPGDIIVRRDNFLFYFPLMTGIVLSIVLSLLFYVAKRLF